MGNRSLTLLARRISLLFNPLLIGAPLVILIGIKDQGGIRVDIIFPAVLCIGILCILPLIYTLALMRIGVISDFNVSDRRQRIYLFPVLLVCFLATVFILYSTEGVSRLVLALLVFGMLNLLACALISICFKISLHCAGLGGLIVGLYIAFGPFMFAFGLACLTLTAWSRIILKEHSRAEVISGALFGLVAMGAEFHFLYGYL